MTEGGCCESGRCQGGRSVPCKARLLFSGGSEVFQRGHEVSVECMGGWRVECMRKLLWDSWLLQCADHIMVCK